MDGWMDGRQEKLGKHLLRYAVSSQRSACPLYLRHDVTFSSQLQVGQFNTLPENKEKFLSILSGIDCPIYE